MDELKRFKKKHKLTKKEKERVEMWVESGHSAYDLQWLYELREEEELDELLSGLTDKQKDYVYSYCMNWNPFIDEPYFDYEKFGRATVDAMIAAGIGFKCDDREFARLIKDLIDYV